MVSQNCVKTENSKNTLIFLLGVDYVSVNFEKATSLSIEFFDNSFKQIGPIRQISTETLIAIYLLSFSKLLLTGM